MFLQALHPLAVRGLVQNSAFTQDPVAVRRADPRISDEQADRYVDEQRRIAELVGLNGEDVPGSQRELESYIADTRSLLRRTPEADQVLRFLLRPQLAGRSRLLLPAWAAGAWLSYSLLPRWAHDLYGKHGLSDQTATAALRAARITAFAVPCT